MKRADCIAKTTYTADGDYISGHSNVAVVAIKDVETGRTYSVLQCDHCGTVDVSFTDSEDQATDMLAVMPVVVVGSK